MKIVVAIRTEDKVRMEKVTLNKDWENVSISDFKNLTISGGSICGFYKTESE